MSWDLFLCKNFIDARTILPFWGGVVNFCLKPDNMVLGNVDPRSQMSTSFVTRAWETDKYVSNDYRAIPGIQNLDALNTTDWKSQRRGRTSDIYWPTDLYFHTRSLDSVPFVLREHC